MNKINLVVLNNHLAYQYDNRYYDVKTLNILTVDPLADSHLLLAIDDYFIRKLISKPIIYYDVDYGEKVFTTTDYKIFPIYKYNGDYDTPFLGNAKFITTPIILSIPNIHLLNQSYTKLPELVLPEANELWLEFIKTFWFDSYNIEVQVNGFYYNNIPCYSDLP